MTAAHLQGDEDDPEGVDLNDRGPGSAYRRTPLLWFAMWVAERGSRAEMTAHPQRSLREIQWQAELALKRRRDTWNDRSRRISL